MHIYEYRYMYSDMYISWCVDRKRSLNFRFTKGTSINDVRRFSEILTYLPTLLNPKTSDFLGHFEPPYLP